MPVKDLALHALLEARPGRGRVGRGEYDAKEQPGGQCGRHRGQDAHGSGSARGRHRERLGDATKLRVSEVKYWLSTSSLSWHGRACVGGRAGGCSRRPVVWSGVSLVALANGRHLGRRGAAGHETPVLKVHLCKLPTWESHHGYCAPSDVRSNKSHMSCSAPKDEQMWLVASKIAPGQS